MAGLEKGKKNKVSISYAWSKKYQDQKEPKNKSTKISLLQDIKVFVELTNIFQRSLKAAPSGMKIYPQSSLNPLQRKKEEYKWKFALATLFIQVRQGMEKMKPP